VASIRAFSVGASAGERGGPLVVLIDEQHAGCFQSGRSLAAVTRMIEMLCGYRNEYSAVPHHRRHCIGDQFDRASDEQRSFAWDTKAPPADTCQSSQLFRQPDFSRALALFPAKLASQTFNNCLGISQIRCVEALCELVVN
jgi:hypothetical protein